MRTRRAWSFCGKIERLGKRGKHALLWRHAPKSQRRRRRAFPLTYPQRQEWHVWVLLAWQQSFPSGRRSRRPGVTLRLSAFRIPSSRHWPHSTPNITDCGTISGPRPAHATFTSDRRHRRARVGARFAFSLAPHGAQRVRVAGSGCRSHTARRGARAEAGPRTLNLDPGPVWPRSHDAREKFTVRLLVHSVTRIR